MGVYVKQSSGVSLISGVSTMQIVQSYSVSSSMIQLGDTSFTVSGVTYHFVVAACDISYTLPLDATYSNFLYAHVDVNSRSYGILSASVHNLSAEPQAVSSSARVDLFFNIRASMLTTTVSTSLSSQTFYLDIYYLIRE